MDPLTSEFYSLIVDDEIDICFLLGHILNKKNIKTVYAYSLSEARQALKKQDFDFIFLDNFLPDGEGIDLIPALRKKTPETGIVMISAYADPHTRDKIVENKVDYFLQKPLSLESIDAVLKKVSKKASFQQQHTLEH